MADGIHIDFHFDSDTVFRSRRNDGDRYATVEFGASDTAYSGVTFYVQNAEQADAVVAEFLKVRDWFLSHDG